MSHVTVGIAVVKTVILLLGSLITYFSYKAFQRTGSKPLRALSIGFAFIVLGALAGGTLHQIVNVDLQIGVLIQSLLTMVGFVVITYSLYTD
ncbi:MAG: hypothetical protein SXQ77_02465 [Halobacteria archaeon]|nr:hypothetical protein [Halobacteria archaeon]